MWQLVLEREGVAREQRLHVGDNEHSEHPMPNSDQHLYSTTAGLLTNSCFSMKRPVRGWHPAVARRLVAGLMANRIFVPGLAKEPIASNCAQRSINIASLHYFGYLVIGPALTVLWLGYCSVLIPMAFKNCCTPAAKGTC